MGCAMQPGLRHSVAVDSVIACGATGTAVSTKPLLDVAPRPTHRRNTVDVHTSELRGGLR